MTDTWTHDRELERRKQIRLRLRPDLTIETQCHGGLTYHVIKDPISLRYHGLSEREYGLFRLMDGQRTLADIQQAFEQSYRPHRVSLEEVESFGQQLLLGGLAYRDAPHAGAQLFERRRKRLRRKRIARWTN